MRRVLRRCGRRRRSAEPVFLALDQNDGHRRLGRDAAGVAEPVPVKHDIAHDENPCTGKAVDGDVNVPEMRGRDRGTGGGGHGLNEKAWRSHNQREV